MPHVFRLLFFQIPAPPPGVDALAGWIIAVLLGALSTVFWIWQRQTAAESKRKDEMIDRLLADLAPRVRRAEERQDRDR